MYAPDLKALVAPFFVVRLATCSANPFLTLAPEALNNALDLPIIPKDILSDPYSKRPLPIATPYVWKGE